jgi:prolyl oligopeptidase
MPQPTPPFRYPPSPPVDLVEDHHGTPVADPYRWLEDDDSPETAAWTAAQNALTRAVLDGPGRDAVRARLRELFDYPRHSVPIRRGDRLFFTRNPGLLNQPVLCVQEGAGGEPHVLIDPNALSEDGTVALTAFAPSEDGGLLAYALSAHGSDWQEVRIRDGSSS